MLNEMFKPVDCPIQPLDERVTVQIAKSKTKTSGGIHLISDIQDAEKWNQQTAKVVALGENAFKNRNGLVLPGERKPTFNLGDYVRIPLHGGDKVEVKYGTSEDDVVLFITVKWYDIIGKITGDPLLIKTIL